MLPSTASRVPAHTAAAVNEMIRQRTKENIARYRNAGPAAIDRRLRELNAEWDIERTLEANAATVSLIGLTLGATVDRRWHPSNARPNLVELVGATGTDALHFRHQEPPRSVDPSNVRS